MEKRRIIVNNGTELMLVCTEPEGQDYWLRPGDSVELRAEIESSVADFEFVKESNGMSVFPSRGMKYISVWSGDKELGCGHQRPPGWGAPPRLT